MPSLAALIKRLPPKSVPSVVVLYTYIPVSTLPSVLTIFEKAPSCSVSLSQKLTLGLQISVSIGYSPSLSETVEKQIPPVRGLFGPAVNGK